jgi:NADPH:quinone reductase-like Zn-dependent oxidoreductase
MARALDARIELPGFFGRIMASYAEYATAPAANLAPKPGNLSFDEAAGVSIGALTAWQAVEDAEVQPGQRVLVQGAAGGVGLYVVQLLHRKGAHVIGTASAANADFVRSLGAEEAVDYTARPFEQSVHDVDAVIDTVGGELIERSFHVLRPGGLLVTVAGRVSDEQAQAHGVRAKSSGASREAKAPLAHIAALLEAGRLRPVVGQVFRLAEAAKAQQLSETGHGRGRITLHIRD